MIKSIEVGGQQAENTYFVNVYTLLLKDLNPFNPWTI